MKAMTKIALVSASILTAGALTACQSNPGSKEGPDGRPMMHGGHHKMSPEQREEMKQKRAQHKALRQQIQKACDGKAIGQTVQVTAGQQNINGTCNIVFKPDHKAMKEMRHDSRRDSREHVRMMYHDGARMKDLTEEQRAQIKQEFAQKRVESKAQWDAIQKSCAGQTDGKAIQVKMGDKIIAGKCVVKFQSEFKPGENMPMMPSKV
ncbi:hypothetical protein AS4_37790 [Acinetobacter guillouiae]|uniref:hypothetical protein n=1 Tax=Acinetobacter guillouiae TaxID=106649 RepID=UPI0004EF6754|nr:hypothetical protein [Acinetobacter guillouiae]BAP38719.1 hypothetical protein AS4_37790 [Acinetobacter guillouiae]